MVMEAHLLSFVERVRSLSDHGSSGDQFISTEFSLIRQKSASLKEEYGLTTVAGEIKENVKKNRYRDILPYDQSRVCLTPTTSEYESDYINASFIKGAARNKIYIATQGPVSSTVVDFWRMIWQHNVKVIIMACREIEMGKKKCEVYWASTTDTSTFGPFTVSTLEELRPNEEVVVRTLVVKYCDEARKVFHFQYTAWPDHGIPDMPDGILGMMELARQKQSNQTDPVVVHCSAGCGRTGVICAIDYVNDLLLTEQIQEDFNIFDLIFELRKQRPSAVQTKEQYGFVFHTVAQMFQKVLQVKNKNTETSTSLYINAVSPKASLGSFNVPSKTRNPLLKPRLSHPLPQTRMNDTYAVVNKPRLQPPSSATNSNTVHHYDNANSEKSNKTPVYSAVKPKNRPGSLLPPPTSPVYDRTTTANQRGGLPPKVMDHDGYELLPGELRSMNRDAQPQGPLSRSPSATGSQSSIDDDYEYVSSVVKDTNSSFAPAGMGFNCRIKKPKGPRDPPAEWSRAES
ncbi:tyrosine-protein phosphatase non-receptor type 18 [Pimephales promelas]|uniref:tyrosine-protein phosphatase non-receptor type 18 n=1 Tax=Pimephales promelas TaxID=90988 RepID=UPI0019558608|nr:tyrosine-protein phosphatase non-receptor type 18 [Pimephales promelas]KAG1972129.1 tyrosine-protein phosphatase non-receptor type [Pimephales promelas]